MIVLVQKFINYSSIQYIWWEFNNKNNDSSSLALLVPFFFTCLTQIKCYGSSVYRLDLKQFDEGTLQAHGSQRRLNKDPQKEEE